MSIDTNHIKLNSNNFCYFAFNCRSEKLSNTDQKTATLATILLSLSLGIGHLLCYILLKHRKITPQPESQTLDFLNPRKSYDQLMPYEEVHEYILAAQLGSSLALNKLQELVEDHGLSLDLSTIHVTTEKLSDFDYYRLGNFYLNKGFIAEAKDHFEQAYRLGNEFAFTELQKLVKDRNQEVDFESCYEDYKKAKEQELLLLEKIVVQENVNALDFYCLGTAYAKHNRIQEAAQAYEKSARMGYEIGYQQLKLFVLQHSLPIDLESVEKDYQLHL